MGLYFIGFDQPELSQESSPEMGGENFFPLASVIF
jgi:hypothetical protein